MLSRGRRSRVALRWKPAGLLVSTCRRTPHMPPALLQPLYTIQGKGGEAAYPVLVNAWTVTRRCRSALSHTEICQQLDFIVIIAGRLILIVWRIFTSISQTIRYRPSLAPTTGESLDCICLCDLTRAICSPCAEQPFAVTKLLTRCRETKIDRERLWLLA